MPESDKRPVGKSSTPAKGTKRHIEEQEQAKTAKPRKALYVTAATLAKLPDNPETNTLIKSYYEFSLYKLTTGEYQLNVGPDFEKKVHVIIWTGCPAQNPYESSFIQGD